MDYTKCIACPILLYLYFSAYCAYSSKKFYLYFVAVNQHISFWKNQIKVKCNRRIDGTRIEPAETEENVLQLN